MLRVWREDDGEDVVVEMDMADPELAACQHADNDVDRAGDYWNTDPPVIVVEDADGNRTRWSVEAMSEHIAYPLEAQHSSKTCKHLNYYPSPTSPAPTTWTCLDCGSTNSVSKGGGTVWRPGPINWVHKEDEVTDSTQLDT
jgi:hypothetical protein